MIKSVTPRRAITVGGTLVCAFGTGLAMQSLANSSVGPEKVADEPVLSSISVTPIPANENHEQENALDGEIESIKLTAASTLPNGVGAQFGAVPLDPLTNAPTILASIVKSPLHGIPQEIDGTAIESPTCEVRMSLTPEAAAMVRVAIDAPCQSDDHFTLRHENLMVADTTDAYGFAEMLMPALSENAVYTVSFEGGDGTVASTVVDTVDLYDRYVVQWTGESGLQLHAMEHGAGYGDEGHVWAGSTRDMSAAAKGEGGFMTRLGNADVANALVAEVYTFPAMTALRGDDVSVSLEAEIDELNCGKDITAQVLVKSGASDLDLQQIVLSVPGCEAVGDFLVLKNLSEDLKLASN